MSLHNNPSDARAYTRRAFLQQGTLFASAAMTVPAFLQGTAFALPRALPGLSSIAGVDEGRILVVVQLSGGNDGLNTVVPYRDDNYRRARPGIGLTADEVHKLARSGSAADVGLHPSMGKLRELYDDGMCAVVQAVGYPNPNRSHFASMDIWHTADTDGTGDGWLGRYVDAQCCGFGKGESGRPDRPNPNQPIKPPQGFEPPIALGKSMPLALQGRAMMPVSFETPDLYRWLPGSSDDLQSAYTTLLERPAPGAHDDHDETPASFLLRTALDARVSSERIRDAVSKQSLVTYPATEFARQLSMVASMVRAGLGTRVYYVSLGSFDTHAGQGGAQGQHARLLGQFADGLRAFYSDLKAQGNDRRVLTMCFSEFGRRVSQNASAGTDHGTAAPMFLVGPMVRAGVHGVAPSLTDLDDGDLKFRVDFRQVYAEVLDDWLATPSATVLESRYRHVDVLRT